MANLSNISDTAFVECHGTGTQAGDPLEAEAIAKVFGGEQGVYIGSIKPNVGHAEGASGISSVIKAVLTLENRRIPPNANFSTPNPKIPFEEANLIVPLEPIPWPEGKVERVSVNSFGVTGSNAHAIIDSAASFVPTTIESLPLVNGDIRRQPQLLVLSASSSESLKRSIEVTQEYATPSCLNDLVYTLGTRRDHLAYRAFAVTDGVSAFEVSSLGKPKKAPQLTFIFTGQGAQVRNYLTLNV
jgi:acyl transferase domain-containing protein